MVVGGARYLWESLQLASVGRASPYKEQRMEREQRKLPTDSEQ